MKINNFKYILLVLIVGGMMSCEKSLDINSDPNKPTVSRPDLLLTTSELYIGNGMGDRVFEIASVWAQYYTGGPGVSIGDWDKNTMATQDGNNLFIPLYRSNSNLDYIAKNSNEPLYTAVAKILMAYNFQVNVDLFGDMPYTEALKGDIKDGFIISPKYDNAKDVIYPGLATMVEDAIALIHGADASAAPVEGDLIYNGDMTKWEKFANSLLLKIYIRSGNSAGVMSLEGREFITDNADNAFIPYPGEAKSKNPFWTDAKSSALGNYFVGSKTTIDYLIATGDPRIDLFFDPTSNGTHNGLKHGDVENSPSNAEYSRPAGSLAPDGGLIFNPKAPVFLMTAWEVNFLLAEAGTRGWLSANAATSYDNGVKQSIIYLAGPGADTAASVLSYLVSGPGAYPSGGSQGEKLKAIALQKWASMDGTQPIESWIETRRLDSPSNPIFASPGGKFATPTNNVLGGNTHPSIMFYPANEADLNKSFPGQHELTDKVFWDN